MIDQHIIEKLKKVYYYMYASRLSDLTELELVNSGEANFLASSRGHEGGAILSPFLTSADWLHCHYRDKALMLARGLPSEQFFYSALCKAESHSAGRQMVSHMSSREHKIMSIVGPVGNNALQAAGVATAVKDQADRPIVLCAIGDGTSQQGEVLEAIAEAKRSHLPVLFFIHNNNLAISTRTQGKTFFSLPNGKKSSQFYDIPIHYFDGTQPLKQYDGIKSVVDGMRTSREPAIIVLELERLDNHSNADDQKLYRSDQELSLAYQRDPIQSSREYLLEQGVSENELAQLESQALAEVRQAVDKARQGSQPQTMTEAVKPLPEKLLPNAPENRGDFNGNDKRLTMLEAFKETLRHRLASDPSVCLLGEDIEDGKGDVFGVTRGLSTTFPGRVKNSPLSESTIVGLGVGMALAGKKPVAFIQFADFAPPAYNQIFTELATMYWRTNGSWQCPMIVFMPCGGYRPGLGPFHSQTNEGTYAHIPGLDVYMPSNASDAVGMLNAAFESGRPSIFMYPKKLLNSNALELTTATDVANRLIPVGKARIDRVGSDITLVAWGNTVSLCQEVAQTLETVGIEAEIIDLRTIKPFDQHAVIQSVAKTKRLIVTHEDNQYSGMGAEVIATVSEKLTTPFSARRVTRPETYTPCNYQNHTEVLPSFERILTAAVELLDLDLAWEQNDDSEDSYIVEVIGASPSDESVLITEMHIEIGSTVKAGEKLVDIEASKSAGEILCPIDGVVTEIYVEVDEPATVGKPLLKLAITAESKGGQQKLIQRRPILSRKAKVIEARKPSERKQIGTVGISQPIFKLGTRKITNEFLLQNFPTSSHTDIVERTGIHSRYWLEEGESIVDYGAEVAVRLLQQHQLRLQDIDVVICATCTPEKYTSPSMACMILDKLYAQFGEHHIPAYDINAACSGYLYALQNAKDYLATRPDHRVLLITAENLSNKLNIRDFDTAFLFGDGATATLVCGENHLGSSVAVIDDILLTSIADNGKTLNVPAHCTINDGITLQGKKLFTFAVKNMASVMNRCCESNGVSLHEMDLVIPHQANLRISQAIEKRLNLEKGSLFSNIAYYGNTSSCTIPIALAETLSDMKPQQRVALCAFGAGFTVGSGLLTMK